jgi:hypothetical protein
VWGELNISNGNYVITIPQSFLNSAIYPVKANDTCGYISIGASNYTQNDSYKGVGGYNVVAGASGTMSKIYVATATHTTEVKVAVYSAITGGTRLTNSYTMTSLNANNWTSVDISAESEAVVSGTSYYPALCFTLSRADVRYDSGDTGNHRYSTSNPYASEMTNPDGSEVEGNLRISVYMEYTVGGGGGDDGSSTADAMRRDRRVIVFD